MIDNTEAKQKRTLATMVEVAIALLLAMVSLSVIEVKVAPIFPECPSWQSNPLFVEIKMGKPVHLVYKSIDSRHPGICSVWFIDVDADAEPDILQTFYFNGSWGRMPWKDTSQKRKEEYRPIFEKAWRKAWE